MNQTKRIAADALFASLALLLFLVEAQIPPVLPIPGIKLGLANIMTLLTMHYCGKADAAAVLFVRIVLGSIFAGNVSTFLYSVTGGALCFLILCLLFGRLRQIWALSIFGAIAHNTGQLLAASVLLRTATVFWYLPYLLLAAVLSGAFTGVAAHAFIRKFKRNIKGSLQ